MLKRQRPSTPPPSLAKTPSSSDFDYGDPSRLSHGAKRRRVVAPALDGRERGMQIDDEDWPDEEDGDSDPAIDTVEGVLRWEEQAGQYKHSNALLHRLHIEHQRRAQPFSPESSSYTTRSNYSTPAFHGRPAKHEYSGTETQLPEEPRFPIPACPSETNIAEEVNQVRARYEENNRYIAEFHSLIDAEGQGQVAGFTRTEAKTGARFISRVATVSAPGNPAFASSLISTLPTVDRTVEIMSLIHGFAELQSASLPPR